MSSLLLIVSLLSASVLTASYVLPSYPSGSCKPFHVDFTSSPSSAMSSFMPCSPASTYALTSNGLELYLLRPAQPVKTSDGVNDVLGQGATINSTFNFLFGKVTYEVESNTIPGVVTAVILDSPTKNDEIDVEILGGDIHHWQSNAYAPAPSDTQPLWGVFGGMHEYPKGTSTTLHAYAVDWRADKITWYVDGHAVRTLTKDQTNVNGTLHYPSQNAMRLSLGIWDGSNPLGTCQWAKGPVAWHKISGRESIKSIVKSITVEC